MADKIVSRPYKPVRCCEACVFGRGPHADWCEKNPLNSLTFDALFGHNPLPYRPNTMNVDEYYKFFK